ncbi:MAG: amino acid permease, partial [Clostridiales bacterium]
TSNGLIESFMMLTGQTTGILLLLFGLVFLYTIIANPISWSLGVNYVAQYAAQDKSMPKVFASENKKNKMPLGANIMNGVIASVMVLAAPLIPSEDLFWSFFSLNMITLLISYILIFPAFLKLRKTEPDIHRPFKISGGKVKLSLMTWVPFGLLIIATVLSAVPLSLDPEELGLKIPILAGTVLAVVIGEIIAAQSVKKLEKGDK